MLEEMKAIILRGEKLWNTGDLTIADEIYAPNFSNHNPTLPEVTDLESYKQSISETRVGMPDFQVKVEAMIAEGDNLSCRWVCTGTHEGTFRGIPASGKKATWTGMSIYRFDSGKIVEAWWSNDSLTMLQQIGVIPTE
jgi:steroid delta-isomerase-like uncharacterized protein